MSGKVAQTVRFTVELLEKIDQYKTDNHLSTRHAAIIELIRKGLKKE